jgi:serine/threonine-protein kinase
MQRVGRYEITGELGRGAMGVVYRALDPAIGRTVAIKSIRLTDLADAAEIARMRERLLREAQSAGLLSHPGIVTIFDVEEQDGQVYVAMELVNGPTLEEVLSSTEAPGPKAIYRILRETAAALDHAHRKGIVHRDIKPANIMIHEDGTVKITDFGVAKISTGQQMTVAGTVIGTPSYMSPEQIQGEPVDGRSDQFSLAVIAYEMLTGEKPFVGEPLPSLLYKIVHEEQPPPQRLNPTLGWQVEVVMRKALEKNSEERYATCTEFIDAIEGACNSSKGWKPLPRGAGQTLPTSAVPVVAPEAAATLPETPVSAEAPRGRLRRIATVVAVLAALGLGAAYIAWKQGWLEQSPENIALQQPAPPPVPSASGRPSPSGPAVEGPKPQQPAQGTTGEQTTEEAALPAEPSVNVPVPPARPETDLAAQTEVLVRTSPPGAVIVFDSNQGKSCKSPCSWALAAGRHTASATLAGHRSALRIFQVPQELDLFLYLAPAIGQVQVLSDPPGASIAVNGRARTERTPVILELPAGKYNIAVTRDGYQRDDQEVDVRDSAFVRLNFRLGKQPAEGK